MTTSTKVLLAIMTFGGITYGIVHRDKKKKAAEAKKRRDAKKKKKKKAA